MKIGILTYHRSYNYGAFMQCYSLVKRLKDDFPNHHIEVIDYTTSSTHDNYIAWTNKQIGVIKDMISERNAFFEVFQTKYLPLSSKKIISNDESVLFNEIKGKYDVIIVGSDAVWNWNGKPFPNAYLLNADLGSLKVSYAASAHGLFFKDLSKNDLRLFGNLISDFAYIGYRESNVKHFLDISGVDKVSYHNCDPTLLLDINDIPLDMDEFKIKLQSLGFDFNKTIIGVMADDRFIKGLRKYISKSIQIIAIYTPNSYADKFISSLNPFEWARIFSFFDLTITHFFHGTLFSLINDVPVIAIDVNNRYTKYYETKIFSLLKSIDLLEYYFLWKHPTSIISKFLTKVHILNFNKLNVKKLASVVNKRLKSQYQKDIKTLIQDEKLKYESFKNFLNDYTINEGKLK